MIYTTKLISKPGPVCGCGSHEFNTGQQQHLTLVQGQRPEWHTKEWYTHHPDQRPSPIQLTLGVEDRTDIHCGECGQQLDHSELTEVFELMKSPTLGKSSLGFGVIDNNALSQVDFGVTSTGTPTASGGGGGANGHTGNITGAPGGAGLGYRGGGSAILDNPAVLNGSFHAPGSIATVEHSNRPWGWFDVLFEGNNACFKVKVIYVEPNRRLSYQSHEHRDELWYAVEGSGSLVMDTRTETLTVDGTMYRIARGEKHRLVAGPNGIKIVEIQQGICREDDITRYEDDYGRTPNPNAPKE